MPPPTVAKTGPFGRSFDRSGETAKLSGAVAPAALSTVRAIWPVDRGATTVAGSVWLGSFTMSGTWATSVQRCSRVSPIRRSASTVMPAP